MLLQTTTNLIGSDPHQSPKKALVPGASDPLARMAASAASAAFAPGIHTTSEIARAAAAKVASEAAASSKDNVCHSATTSSCKSSGPAISQVGWPLNVSSTEGVVEVNSCWAHRFQFPGKRNDTILCVPQKNGNRNFGGVLHMMWFGSPPSSFDEVVKVMPKYDFTQVSPCKQVWIVTRNPYTRFLSLYLQKVSVNCLHDQSVDKKLCLLEKNRLAFKLGYEASKPPDFPEFVHLVDRWTTKYGNHLCSIDHHMCSQVAGCVFRDAAALRVLKLEEMSTWFPSFAEELGLTENDLSGSKWTSFSGQPCYYTSTGDCADMLKTIEKTDHVVLDHVHATSASSQTAVYTPEAAALVYKFYKKDFEILGYPLWDGRGEVV